MKHTQTTPESIDDDAAALTTKLNEGQIRADRACVGCGFNLFGQRVYKEEHYDLSVARCPECGTIAALQSYPTMSHWVNRFRMIIASIWVIVLLGLFVVNIMVATAFTMNANHEAGRGLAEVIGAAQQAWTLEHESDEQQLTISVSTRAINGVLVPAFPTGSSYRWTVISKQWREEELEETIRLSGGVWANLNREFLIFLIPVSLIALFFGIFWSVSLLGASRKRALIIPLCVCTITAAFVYGVGLADGNTDTARAIAEQLTLPIVTPIVLGAELLALSLGVFFGRKIARGVITLAMPPRGRVPFSILWTRDGLELPKP